MVYYILVILSVYEIFNYYTVDNVIYFYLDTSDKIDNAIYARMYGIGIYSNVGSL